MNNTFIDFVLSNGEEVKLTYYFRALDVVFSKEESDGLMLLSKERITQWMLSNLSM